MMTRGYSLVLLLLCALGAVELDVHASEYRWDRLSDGLLAGKGTPQSIKKSNLQFNRERARAYCIMTQMQELGMSVDRFISEFDRAVANCDTVSLRSLNRKQEQLIHTHDDSMPTKRKFCCLSKKFVCCSIL